MNSLTAGTVARAYLVAVLVLCLLVSSPFQIGVALALLIAQLYSAYRQPKSSSNLVLVVSSLVFAPLALEALAGLYSVLLIVPALFLLDLSLKNFALTQKFFFSGAGRRDSFVLKALGAGLFLVFGVSVLVWNVTLILGVIVILAYLAFVLAGIFRGMPEMSLAEEKTWRRTFVGNTETVEFTVKGKASMPILVSLQSTDSWVHVNPSHFLLPAKKETHVTVQFTPPLAGPTKIRIQASYLDSRGLLQIDQVLEPVDLHIIPRAKYVHWLANKYLEQTSPSAGTAISSPQPSYRAAIRGVEFLGSRSYQSGDRLKDIDWRHSYMLGELIVKEFADAQWQVGIIVADLTAKDAEDADALAYNFVMSALTLATKALPSALAVYNRSEVLSVTRIMNPRETLKKTLALTEKITVVESKEKVLQPTEIRRLKRTIGQLGDKNKESILKLSEILKFELNAAEEAVKIHPSTLALAKVIENLQGPAVVILVSSMGDNSDALLLSLERLRAKGYGVVMVRDLEKRLFLEHLTV
jgi:uncharacterized protein (DUF58 family)